MEFLTNIRPFIATTIAIGVITLTLLFAFIKFPDKFKIILKLLRHTYMKGIIGYLDELSSEMSDVPSHVYAKEFNEIDELLDVLTEDTDKKKNIQLYLRDFNILFKISKVLVDIAERFPNTSIELYGKLEILKDNVGMVYGSLVGRTAK